MMAITTRSSMRVKARKGEIGQGKHRVFMIMHRGGTPRVESCWTMCSVEESEAGRSVRFEAQLARHEREGLMLQGKVCGQVVYGAKGFICQRHGQNSVIRNRRGALA